MANTKREIDDEALEKILQDEDMASTEELRRKYLERTGEDSLGWNTLQNHLEKEDGYVGKPVGDGRARTHIWRLKNNDIKED